MGRKRSKHNRELNITRKRLTQRKKAMCSRIQDIQDMDLEEPMHHTATHYNPLQRTAIHCNTLQSTTTHCNTLQHITIHYNALQHIATHCNTLQHTATHCNTLQQDQGPSAAPRKTGIRTAGGILISETHCNTLQHAATHCNPPKSGEIALETPRTLLLPWF